MLVLHAGFRARRLLLWGEVPDAVQSRRAPGDAHPFCAGSQIIRGFLEGAGVRVSGVDAESAAVSLPTVRNAPVPSTPLLADVVTTGKPNIARWTVETVTLDARATLEFLCYCAGRDPSERGVIAGSDLTYWIAAMRFAGALVARQQFLPAIDREDTGYYARWHAAYVGREDDRRRALAAAMPPSNRALTPNLPVDLLLSNIIDTVVDQIVRSSRPDMRARPRSQPARPLAARPPFTDSRPRRNRV